MSYLYLEGIPRRSLASPSDQAGHPIEQREAVDAQVRSNCRSVVKNLPEPRLHSTYCVRVAGLLGEV